MKKNLLLIIFSLLKFFIANSQCLIPNGVADSLTPVTGNFYFDSLSAWGPGSPAQVFNIARAANTYYLYGNFTNIGPSHGSGVIVDSASKTLISSRSWKINGFVFSSVPDGQGGFYIGGDFTQIGNVARNHIAQIDASGKPTAWNPNANQTVYALYKTNDTLFLGGSFSYVANQFRPMLAAYSLSGDSLLRDRLYPDTSIVGIGTISVIKPHGSNKLFIGGRFMLNVTNVPGNIMEYDIVKGTYTSWEPQNVTPGNVASIEVSQDDKIVAYTVGDGYDELVANDITTGNPLYTITFYNEFGSNYTGQPYCLKRVGSTLYVAGVFSRVIVHGISTPINGLCSINMATGDLQNFDLKLNTSCVRFLDLHDNNLIISGPFSKAGDSAREHFLMVDTGTFAINPWNPSPSDEIKTISFSNGNIFLGGLFNGIQSYHRNGLAAFDAATGNILPFNPPNPAAQSIPGVYGFSGLKMAIRGDTLFLLINTSSLGGGSGPVQTNLLMYSLSTGAPIPTPNMNVSIAIRDFMLDGNYFYAAVDYGIRRYNLPYLTLDPSWNVNFNYTSTQYMPSYLVEDSTKIYAVGDYRVDQSGVFTKTIWGYLSKIEKANPANITTWRYVDTAKYGQAGNPHFDRAILADSLIFVQGVFYSLNGTPTDGIAAINLNNGNLVNWSKPPVQGYANNQHLYFSSLKKLILSQHNFWFGISSFTTEYPYLADFGAIDSSSGLIIPSPVAISANNYSPTVSSDYGILYQFGGFVSVNDFLFDNDYFTMVGGFDYINGEMHRNIVRIPYSSYSYANNNPTISGKDTVTTYSDSVSYTLPNNLAYTWSYSGANTTIVNNGQNPALINFGGGATSGVLSANGIGYCGISGSAGQKNVVVIHVSPTPTKNACCITFSNIQSNQISLALTSGNGIGRLVIASTSPVPSIPLMTITYAANEKFGMGSDLGGGNFVVYSGPGDTVTVNGLQPSTRYYFTVYEFNGASDSINYLVPNASTANSITLATKPSLAPSHLIFSDIGPTSVTISCTPGNGSNRIYLFKSADSINALPQNGTSYYANVHFKSGYGFSDSSFVISDTGTSIGVLNLMPGTLYYARVLEYSGNSDSANYLESSFLEDTVRTINLAPTVGASGLHFINITSHSVNVICTPGNGQKRLFVVREGSPVINTPVSGQSYVKDTLFGGGSNIGNNTYVVADTGTSAYITGLMPSTIYYVAIFESNNLGNTEIYLDNPFPMQSFTTDSVAAIVNWQDSNFTIRVFPNPVQQNCYIQIQSNEITSVSARVMDISGKQLFKYSFQLVLGINNFELENFAGLPNGIYILYLQIGTHKAMIKLFKD